jgi:hypothetical protein
MTNYIPVELLKSPNAVNVLSMIDIVSHIIPQEDPAGFISNINRKRMTRYDIEMLERNLNTVDTFDIQYKKFVIMKNYSNNLDKARKEYMLYYKNKNFEYSRLGTYKEVQGVGSNGGGLFPDNYSKEIEAVSIIHGDVERRGKWPIVGSIANNTIEPNKENHILYQSIRGIIGWPSANFGNLSLGSPCQMISAIIGLTGNPEMNITGEKFIQKRKECEGLRYLLDGNKHDMESGYDGVYKFDRTSFRNFFFATGAVGGNNFVVLKCGPGISEITPQEVHTALGATPTGLIVNPHGTGAPEYFNQTRMERPQSTLHSTLILSHKQNPPPNEKNIFYFNTAAPPTFTIADPSMKKALIHMFSNQPDDQVMRKCRFGSIMLIYSMFYMYGMYIYNLYEKMIKDLKLDGDLKDKYMLANKKMLDSLLDYVNYMINKKFKLGQLNSSKDLIIVSNHEIVSRDKTVPATVFQIPASKTLTPDHSLPAGGNPERYRTELDPKGTKTAMSYVKLDGLTGTIYVGFKDSSIYESEDLFSDEALYSKDNYPIAFSDYTTCDEIDYVPTFKRLYEFLSIGNEYEEPKLNDKIISLGAPLQNDEMIENLTRVLDAYYGTVANSRETFLNYMDLKLNIFKSSISAKVVSKLRDDLLKNFGLINMISQKELREIKLVELAKEVMAKYRQYRRDELKLTDDKAIYKTRNAIKNTSLNNFIKEQSRFMKKLKQGTFAIIQYEVAKLTHQLFLNKNPTSALGNVFINTVNSDAKEIDDEMDKELRQFIARKTNNIAQKYGANALKHTANIHLLRFSDIPKTPATYLSSIHSLYTSLSRGSSTVPSGIIGGPASGSSHPFQKSFLTAEQKIRVSTTQFWKDMKLSFNGKTLYLPAIKISTSRGATIFNDSNFYMIDVLNSMILGRLIPIRLYPLNQKTIYARLNRTGYLMLSAITEDLSNPDRWMAIDFRHFARMLKNDGEMGFRKIAQGRSDFFNLLANNGYLVSMMNNSIPAISQTSRVLTSYCSKVLKKELNQCSLFISQPQFAQNVQSRMDMFESTKGIDLRSGYSFYEYSIVGIQNTIQR